MNAGRCVAQVLDRLAAILCGAASLLFAFSGYEKLDAPHLFETAIRRHGVGIADIDRLAEAFGIGEVLLGLSLALTLLFPSVAKWAYVAPAAVLCGFTAYLCVIWAQRGPVLDCGCSGILPLPVAAAAVRNMILVLALGWRIYRQVARLPGTVTRRDPASGRRHATPRMPET